MLNDLTRSGSKGEEGLAQEVSLFSVGHTSKVPAIGAFQSVARSGQKSIAQGLPWVNSPMAMSPEGAGRYGGNRLRTSERYRVQISSPFRAKPYFRPTQGKPWAKLSCPFGAGPLGTTTALNTYNPGRCFFWPLRATDHAGSVPQCPSVTSVRCFSIPVVLPPNVRMTLRPSL
jgi:hypothetical protein